MVLCYYECSFEGKAKRNSDNIISYCNVQELTVKSSNFPTEIGRIHFKSKAVNVNWIKKTKNEYKNSNTRVSKKYLEEKKNENEEKKAQRKGGEREKTICFAIYK